MDGTGEHHLLSEVSQIQKAQATCSLSYVEYRPNINEAIIMKNRSH
jgi:hypothetical protein